MAKRTAAGRSRFPVVRCRRAGVWVTAVPLMLLGSQLAHFLAFRLVYPQTQLRLRALLATGHGYMVGYPGYLPLVAGACGAMELVAFVWMVAGGVRRAPRAPVPPAAFALMPVIAFSLQEFLEQWLAGASFPWQLVLEPTFRVGLLLQLPFAVLMYLLARLLLRAAEQVVSVVGRLRPPFVVLREQPVRRAGGFALLRRPTLAGGHSGRGPPCFSSTALAVGRF